MKGRNLEKENFRATLIDVGELTSGDNWPGTKPEMRYKPDNKIKNVFLNWQFSLECDSTLN